MIVIAKNSKIINLFNTEIDNPKVKSQYCKIIKLNTYSNQRA